MHEKVLNLSHKNTINCKSDAYYETISHLVDWQKSKSVAAQYRPGSGERLSTKLVPDSRE